MIAVTKGLIEDEMMKHISVSLECRTDINSVYIVSSDGDVLIISSIVFYPTFLIAKNSRSPNEIHIKYSNICAMEFIIKEDEND
jgi:hypothetical protein